MNKIVALIAVVVIGLCAFNISHAQSSNNREWSEWWFVGKGSVKRIYDHENKLVCWIYDGAYAGGISCVPYTE